MHSILTAGGFFYTYMPIVVLNIIVTRHLKLIVQPLYTGTLSGNEQENSGCSMCVRDVCKRT